MTVLPGALVALAVLALLACVVLLARDVQAEQRATREQLFIATRALAAQLARQHEEQRRHIDAAAAAIVAQLSALPPASRPRPAPRVEARAAPPLRPHAEDATPPAGTPRPRGARAS